MPCGDGTGPWWTKEKNGKCNRRKGFNRGVGWKSQQRNPLIESTLLTKDEQRKIMEDKLKAIEEEKQLLTKQLKEYDS